MSLLRPPRQDFGDRCDVWVDGRDLQKAMRCSERTIRLKAQRGELKTRLAESRGANGKHRREYLLSSAPAKAQMKHAHLAASRRRQTSAMGGLPAEIQSCGTKEGTLELFEHVPVSDSLRMAVPEELRAQTEARYTAIGSMLDFRRPTNGRRRTFKLASGKKVSNLDGLAEYIAAQQTPPVCAATVWRWYMRFIDKKTGGYAALADAPRKDKGQSRFFEKHPVAAVFLQTKFLHEGLSRQMAWEALAREWPKIEKKGEPPHYDTARSYLNALPEPAKVLAREGKQAHGSKCSPHIQREKQHAMDWWVADHRVFDVLIRNSLFGELPAQKAFRLWMTMVCDWGSRKIVGFCFAPTPSSRTISSALRLAILSHGMPRNFYWDNGEDYKKVRRDLEAITLSQEAGALLARDGVTVGITSALPFRARSKPIESWFARWSKRFDVLWRPAYLGNKPGACPESARAAQKQHEDFLKGKRAGSPLPLDAEFIAATVQWIEEYNSTRLESLDHRKPNEVMEEQCPEASRKQIDPRLLDILFWERDLRTVQAGGCVELDRRRYEPTDASLLAMDMRKGRQVMVLRDPYNLGEAVAADAETLQFIGELRIQQFVAQCPGGQITRDQIKAAMRRERSLRRGYSEYLAALAAIATSQGWQTEREALVDRALQRTGTDARAFPAAGVPGARLLSAAPAAPREISSPFVDDAAAEFIAAMSEEEGKA